MSLFRTKKIIPLIKNGFSSPSGRWLYIGILALVVFVPTFAQANVITNVGFNVISSFFTGITYVVSFVGAVLIAVLSWLISILMDWNARIMDFPVIQVGLPVTTAIAQSFLSLMLVFMAFATMFGLESYAMRKALPPLLAVAILNNFIPSLARAVLAIPNGLFIYFMNAVNPSNGPGGFEGFVTAFAGVFNPHTHFLPPQGAGAPSDQVLQSAVLTDTPQEIRGPLIAATGLFFVIISQGAIILTLGVLLAMLFVRAIKLPFYIILFPFGNVARVFPATRGQAKTMDTKFLQQAFFLPIVGFFLWLTVISAHKLKDVGGLNIEQYADTSGNSIWAAIAGFMTSVFSSAIGGAIQLGSIVFIALGGIFAANHLSIQFAGGAVSAAGTVGKWAWNKTGGAAGRGGLAAGRGAVNRLKAPLRALPADRIVNASEKLRAFRDKGGWRKFVGAGTLATAVGGVGLGFARVKRGAQGDLVKEYEKKLAHKSAGEVRARLAMGRSTSAAERVAAHNKLAADKEYTRDSTGSYYTKGVEKLYKNFGMEKQDEKNQKIIGKNRDMHEIEQEIDNEMAGGASETSPQVKALQESLDNAATKFYSSFKPHEISNLNLNDVFGSEPKVAISPRSVQAIQKAIAAGLSRNPQLVGRGAISRMDSGNMKNFAKQYSAAFSRDSLRAKMRGDAQEAARVQGAYKRFRDTLGNYTYGAEAGGGSRSQQQEEEEA